MTYGLCDLRLAEALAERRKAAAWRARISMRRRHYSREGPPERSTGCDCVTLQRPAPSGAAGNG
jgi:hypothetical protein